MVLKKMVMGNFATEKVDGEIIEAIDFMVERVWISVFQKLLEDKENIYRMFYLRNYF